MNSLAVADRITRRDGQARRCATISAILAQTTRAQEQVKE
jgi:hypothetical protein